MITTNPAAHAIVQSTTTNARESEIVLAAQAGSQRAFAELHAIYSRRLYSTIIAITKNPEDAEDVLQETFLRIHRAIQTFEGRANFYTWMSRIAINSALMLLRKRRHRSECPLDSPLSENPGDSLTFDLADSAPSPEEACDINQRWVILLSAVRKLDSRIGKPIRMQMSKGSSVKEIGRALNLSDAAVKARLYRARVRLSAACRRS